MVQHFNDTKQIYDYDNSLPNPTTTTKTARLTWKQELRITSSERNYRFQRFTMLAKRCSKYGSADQMENIRVSCQTAAAGTPRDTQLHISNNAIS